MKDKGGIFEKPLSITFSLLPKHCFQETLFENHVLTLTKLQFYVGTKDIADPVDIKLVFTREPRPMSSGKKIRNMSTLY